MSKGGKREGAGRPMGQGRFGLEPTKQIRVPTSKISEIHAFLRNEQSSVSLPLYSSKVQAGLFCRK